MNHHLINVVSAASLTPWEEKQGRKPLETSVLPLSIAPCAITAQGLRSCATPWGKKNGNESKTGKGRGKKAHFSLWLLYYYQVPFVPAEDHPPHMLRDPDTTGL